MGFQRETRSLPAAHSFEKKASLRHDLLNWVQKLSIFFSVTLTFPIFVASTEVWETWQAQSWGFTRSRSGVGKLHLEGQI